MLVVKVEGKTVALYMKGTGIDLIKDICRIVSGVAMKLSPEDVEPFRRTLQACIADDGPVWNATSIGIDVDYEEGQDDEE